MNTKKKTVLAAALVVAIIALAGVGYAAFSTSYTGKTTSVEQTYDVDYVVVKLDANNGYGTVAANNMLIVFDSETEYVDSAVTTTYFWKGSSIVQHDVTVTIPADGTNDRDQFTLSLQLDTTALTATMTAGYTVQYKDSDDTEWTSVASSGTIDIGTITITNTTYEESLYFRCVPTTIASSVETMDDASGEADEHVMLGTTAPGTTNVKLPAITYTVNATQKA